MEGVIAKSASVWQQKIGKNKMQKNDLVEQITLYLSNGGLFNPELANHVAVRDLLIECREALAQLEQEQLMSDQINYGMSVTQGGKRIDPMSIYKEPEQKPVALETVYETIIQWDEGGGKRSRRELARRIVSLYTTPPQRKPLTLDELWRVFTRSGLSQFHQRHSVVEYKYQKCIEEFARAIEAAHGIKGEA